VPVLAVRQHVRRQVRPAQLVVDLEDALLDRVPVAATFVACGKPRPAIVSSRVR
jgi:hypothetical protein